MLVAGAIAQWTAAYVFIAPVATTHARAARPCGIVCLRARPARDFVVARVVPEPAAPAQTTTGGAVGSLSTGYAALDADDLDAVC